TGLNIGTRKALWLCVVLGLASVIWILIRVVPKPSRAAYPCQKVAQPLAAGFIVWLLGLVGSSLIIQRARSLFQRHRYVVAVICFATAVLLSFLTMSDTHGVAASAGTFVPTDSANNPVGIAKGINPGRVVWVYDSLLSDQGSKSGWWWEDKRTDPKEAQRMMNQALLNLTGIDDPVKSWDSLFKYFNKTRYNQNDVGYKAGDKIAIKVNNIFSRFYQWTDSQDGRPCPQMLHALIGQLVNNAGVPEEDITIYDCNFYHGDPVYKYNHTDFPSVRWAEGDATDRVDGHSYEKGPGSDPGTREKVVPDTNCVVYYGDPNLVPGSGTVCLPTVVSKAKYLINIALSRPHELAGVTLCAKNFFGSVWHPNPPPGNAYYYHGWCPFYMHKAVASLNFAADIPMRPMGSYNALVDLMGHKDLGGKTLLFIGECIRPKYWSAPPFKGRPASSLFMSQDIVAIESVLLDFLQSAGVVPTGTPDNYLHEAAQADNPPSGTVYDPENDGIRLQSLGVHEHWNNPTDKQYSRNLGTGKGVELIQIINNTPTVVEHSSRDIPETFTLFANYPNPFNPSTKIRYAIPQNSFVLLKVFDLDGREIVTLVNEEKASGNYEVTFNANNLSSGIYFYQLKTENYVQTKKMILLQ
ncbi:MAG: T9SS type A sorting domain-containing protein, partial [Chloroflexi bacterium]|nr:T9SS type A sorting domain-containing protein [Chloroflexota bacterium]